MSPSRMIVISCYDMDVVMTVAEMAACRLVYGDAVMQHIYDEAADVLDARRYLRHGMSLCYVGSCSAASMARSVMLLDVMRHKRDVDGIDHPTIEQARAIAKKCLPLITGVRAKKIDIEGAKKISSFRPDVEKKSLDCPWVIYWKGVKYAR